MLKKVFVALFAGKILLLFYLSVTLNSCANVVAPIGGDRDSIPPNLVEEESTLNFQTNFEKQVIELTFDEWVVLEDAFNQVIVFSSSGTETGAKTPEKNGSDRIRRK